MLSSAVPKTLLSLLLLSVIAAGSVAQASEAVQAYRFGGWTLIAPAGLDARALSDAHHTLAMPATGLELLAYWQDGRERALALRFSGRSAQDDAVVLKSASRSHRLKG